MAKVTGFDLPPEWDNLFALALRSVNDLVETRVEKQRAKIPREQLKWLMTRNTFKTWEPFWGAMTTLERDAFNELPMNRMLRGYPAYVQQNWARQKFGLARSDVPDSIPQICGHLYIPAGVSHAVIEHVMDVPYFRYKGNRNFITEKKLKSVNFVGHNPFTCWAWGETMNYTHGAASLQQEMTCYSKTGTTFTPLGTIAGDGTIDSSGHFTFGTWIETDWANWYDTADRFVFRMIFNNVHGHFFIRKALLAFPRLHNHDIAVTRNMYMADVDFKYPSYLSQIKGGWQLGSAGAGVYLESTLPAKYGYT